MQVGIDFKRHTLRLEAAIMVCDTFTVVEILPTVTVSRWNGTDDADGRIDKSYDLKFGWLVFVFNISWLCR